MLNKTDAITITKKYYEDKKRQQLQAIQEFCDNIVDRKIRESAEIGGSSTKVMNIPISINEDELASYISENYGFKVELEIRRSMWIYW